MQKDLAKEKMKELVDRFNKYEDAYLATTYKEAELRLHFLDHFFGILGWNISMSGTQNPADLEVVIENSLESEKNTKFIDYVFKVNRKIQFLVEAKKPSENLSKKEHIFQAKSYAFTSEIPFVILTNFKELRFYDVSTEPLFNQPETDKVSEYCFEYTEYIEKFDEIWNLFSREAVISKSLAKFYATRRGIEYSPDQIFNLNYQVIKGNSLLDIAFLRDLKKWRKELAEEIFNNNSYTAFGISEVVQRILDRLIFIRIIEDRDIENKEYLKELVEKWKDDASISIKEGLDDLCKTLNQKFNGLIFHDHTFTNEATIDSKVLSNIIENLYYPNSPYNFKLIKPEILGRIFEQFLGEKVSIKNDDIVIELKEMNKKSGGVYYTPSYIVESIIEKTFKNKVSEEVSLEKLAGLKIADIACGSGSFLISAYKTLIGRYQYIYSQMPQEELLEYKQRNLIFEDNGRILLTMEHKKEILQQNIYGVDIDSQAIEVAKLSLYITMLEEGYREGSMRPILPDLNDNIKHGNSIINSDIFLADEISFDTDLVYPFDWQTAFEEVIDSGGFDIIVGNPPYIRLQIFEDLYGRDVIKFLKNNYVSAEKFNFDIYVIFVEKAISLLNENGVMGYIVMNKFFITQYGENLRKLISSKKFLSEIVDFGINEIFNNVTTYTCLLILDMKHPQDVNVQVVHNLQDWQVGIENTVSTISAEDFTNSPWYLSSNTEVTIFEHFKKYGVLLKEVSDKVFVGVQTDCDAVYILKEEYEDGEYIYCHSEYTNEVHKFEKEHLKPFLKGSLDIRRYTFSDNKKWLIFPYINDGKKSELISNEEYLRRFPYTWTYLNLCKERLSKRSSIKKEIETDVDYKNWYKYIYKKNHTQMNQPKIIFPAISKKSSFSLDDIREYFFVGSGAGGGGGGAITLPAETEYDYNSLLGILNSEIVTFQIIKRGSKHKGNFYGIDKSRIEDLYLPLITEENKLILKDVSKLVVQISKAFNQITQADTTDTKKNQLIQRINMLESRIDNLTYDLYNIPEELKSYIKATLES